MIKSALALFAGASLAVAATPAAAQAVVAGTVTIDENGNGSLVLPAGTLVLASSLRTDPGPGGLANVLSYALPAGVTFVSGDVLLQDNGAVLDVIRFISGNSDTGALARIFFYSDNIDGADALGDTLGPPSALYTNNVTIPEVGQEGNNGAFYTPTANQPGFVSGFNVTYHFISDGSAVPEPGSWAMMLIGFGAIGFAVRRRSRPAAVPAA